MHSDKSHLYYFADTTIEHIYPQTATGALYDTSMDELKNTIGNLTILGSLDNSTIGNDDFTEKRKILRLSQAKMNVDIAENTNWNRTTIINRTEQLKDMAIKIFKIQ